MNIQSQFDSARNSGQEGCFEIKKLSTQPINFVDFRYSNDSRADPTDVIIVDLQNTKLGRPGIELAYFFCSSTSPEQRKEHLDELLKLYYDEFFQQLTQLGGGCEKIVYTFEELKEEVNECYAFGFIMGCLHSQVIMICAEISLICDCCS